MTRLSWIETHTGWRSGRYHIELAAPNLWVLSRQPRRATLSPIEPVRVLRTCGSLRELKQIAASLETRRTRTIHLMLHLALMVGLGAVTLMVPNVDSPWFLLSITGLFIVALRTVVVWVDMLTGSAWARVSQTYQ